jgi:hypothetical protein
MADVICTHHLHVEFGWFAAEKENLRDGGVALAAAQQQARAEAQLCQQMTQMGDPPTYGDICR